MSSDGTGCEGRPFVGTELARIAEITGHPDHGTELRRLSVESLPESMLEYLPVHLPADLDVAHRLEEPDDSRHVLGPVTQSPGGFHGLPGGSRDRKGQ